MTTIDELFAFVQVQPGDKVDHGVKGQRWGIRRDRGPDGTVSGNPANKISSNPRKLTDEDLRAAVNRMQLERQFQQLSSERVSKGESFTKNMLKEIGKKQVKRVANTAADIAVEQAIKQLGVKTDNQQLGELATRLKPKKKK